MATLLTSACFERGNPGAFTATRWNQCAFDTGAFLAGTTAEAAVSEGNGYVGQKSSSWGDENGYASQTYSIANCASSEVLTLTQSTETLIVPKERQPDWHSLDAFINKARSKGLLTDLDGLTRAAGREGLASHVQSEIPRYEQGLLCACELALKNELPAAEMEVSKP